MKDAPKIRTLACHVALQYVDALPEPSRSAILQEAGDVTEIRSAFQFSWSVFHKQIAILDAMRRHLPHEAWLASQRQLMLGYLEKPVLRTMLDSAVRMVGMSVRTLAKWTPRGFDALFRNAGKMSYEPGATLDEALIVLDNFPRDLFRSGSFLEAQAAALEVIFLIVKTTGRVIVSDVNLETGHARFTLRSGA